MKTCKHDYLMRYSVTGIDGRKTIERWECVSIHGRAGCSARFNISPLLPHQVEGVKVESWFSIIKRLLTQ